MLFFTSILDEIVPSQVKKWTFGQNLMKSAQRMLKWVSTCIICLACQEFGIAKRNALERRIKNAKNMCENNPLYDAILHEVKWQGSGLLITYYTALWYDCTIFCSVTKNNYLQSHFFQKFYLNWKTILKIFAFFIYEQFLTYLVTKPKMLHQMNSNETAPQSTVRNLL